MNLLMKRPLWHAVRCPFALALISLCFAAGIHSDPAPPACVDLSDGQRACLTLDVLSDALRGGTDIDFERAALVLPRADREELQNSYLFEDLDQVREITYDWLIAYNERRPHDALGGLPPTVFREQQTAKNSTYELST